MVVMMMVHGELRAVEMAVVSATIMNGTVVCSTVVSGMAVFLGECWAASEDHQSNGEQA